MSLREALQDIHRRHGKLTPQLIVDEARRQRTNAGQRIHAMLEWDDDKAGERWRLAQAQELIRSVRVKYRDATDDEAERSVRGFHAIRNEDGYTYHPVETVIQDEFQRRLVLADMEREWRQLKQRYDQFEEFLQMVRTDLEEAA
jgi:hypothetical protein